MKITFDPDKAQHNIDDHGVSFEEAQSVLSDPYAMTNEDTRHYDEHRYITLGMSNYAQILVVVWTLRNDEIRLISSWKANSTQRRQYNDQ